MMNLFKCQAVVFKKKLLHDITHNIVFSACIFESRTEVHHADSKLGDLQHLSNFETHQRWGMVSKFFKNRRSVVYVGASEHVQ